MCCYNKDGWPDEEHALVSCYLKHVEPGSSIVIIDKLPYEGHGCVIALFARVDVLCFCCCMSDVYIFEVLKKWILLFFCSAM
jgi:hypothetical protein